MPPCLMAKKASSDTDLIFSVLLALSKCDINLLSSLSLHWNCTPLTSSGHGVANPM